MKRLTLLVLLTITTVAGSVQFAHADDTITVGSKKFTESYVLGEILKKTLANAGFAVQHKRGIGATGIVWEALKKGDITVYPEYTGTIREEILKTKSPLTLDEMREQLKQYGVGMGNDLGFNDTYALVMRRDKAQKLGIKTISDLQQHTDLRISLSNEFIKRKDGWQPLSQTYGITALQPKGIEHGLAYKAIVADQIDLTDAYSTDAGIASNDLVTLVDEKNFFPAYHAVLLYRLNTPPKALAALKKLEGTIDEQKMTRLNAEAEKSKDYTEAAALYFGTSEKGESVATNIARWTGEHLRLVGISLLLAILVGVPLGIVAARGGAVGSLILGGVGVIQTIPSLALLTLFVPLLGINATTAILALFLYSLLPIVRNTSAGLQSIPPALRESAQVLGLSPWAQMTKVYLPMASRTILAGVRTSAVINVGTATLAALIGAGGLGEPIVSGLTINDNATIFQGAIPAAVLALIVEGGFGLLDRVLIPKGLRL